MAVESLERANGQLRGAQNPLVRAFRFARRWPLIPGLLLTLLVICGVFAPFVAPHDPIESDLRARRTPPIWAEGGSSRYILGTDQQGRDLLSRVIYGARISLIVALTVLGLAGVGGVTLGLVAGYFGRWVDEAIMRLMDLQLAIPFILIALVVVIVVGQSFTVIIGLLAINAWSGYARLVRAETLQLKTMDYVALAKVSGASTFRILYRHIFPGVVNTVLVVATLQVGGLILAESILSFLGAGIPPPTPAWGLMVSDGRTYLSSAWWIAFFPGVAIFLTVFAFNFLGDWLRDKLDPRLRQLT
jgi:peptide/nickel transport system permease protein